MSDVNNKVSDNTSQPLQTSTRAKVQSKYIGVKFTKLQQRMLDVLSDGQAHSRKELWKCLGDELAPMSNIRAHLWAIRNFIRPFGDEIVCELRGKMICYRQVTLIQPHLLHTDHTAGK